MPAGQLEGPGAILSLRSRAAPGGFGGWEGVLGAGCVLVVGARWGTIERVAADEGLLD